MLAVCVARQEEWPGERLRVVTFGNASEEGEIKGSKGAGTFKNQLMSKEYGMPKLPEDNALAELAKRLDTIIAISLNPLKIQEATVKEKIALLVSFGLQNQEIARILRTTPALVAKERSLLKKSEMTE